MKICKLGIIACGGRGKNAWRAHQPENGTVVAAGADVDPGALLEFKEHFPDAGIFRDYRELLALREIDAVIISSPLFFHEKMALDALCAGKSVFLEKPMAASVESCDRIISLARKNHLKIMVGHNLRKFSFVSGMKEVIDSGAIGKVKTVWCRHFVGQGRHYDDFFHDYSTPRYSHGLLLHKGCHDIDAIHWFAGSHTVKVTGIGSVSAFEAGRRVDSGLNPQLDRQEDLNMILMELENGVAATYLQCHFSPDDFRNYTIIGTLGRIENTENNYGKSTIHLWSNRLGKTIYETIKTPAPEISVMEDADNATLNAFLEYLKNDVVPYVTAQDARYAVAAALAGKRSIELGGIAQTVTECPEKNFSENFS